MVKRISCRVVRSKPLGRSSDALQHASPVRSKSLWSTGGFSLRTSNRASTSNNAHPKIGDVVIGVLQGKYTGNSVTYTRLLDITSVSIDNDLTGQILDCYV